MNALVVSVDYADCLAVTLPRNAKHFEQVVVVSTHEDRATAEVVRHVHNADLIVTDAFYRDGALFAKDLAIVEGLRMMGGSHWITLLDADILLPDPLPMPTLGIGTLYGARRRMCPTTEPLSEWAFYPRQPDRIFAGYFQLFHSDDPNVQPWPNYPIDPKPWYSDTIFQDRWPPEKKHWLPFDVLHIGDPPRQNWLGRSPGAREQLRAILANPENTHWRSRWSH